MSLTREVFGLARAPRGRLAGASILGALTVIFGVGLMASAGYLISRAAQRPPVLSLMVVIVAVQFFGLARPVARYLERLASHDLALRVLGDVRTRVYDRIEPLAPVQLDAFRRGDLLSRMVADIDALQDLYLRGLEPVLVALLAGAVSVGAAIAVMPAAGLALAVGLLTTALVVPAVSGWVGARTGRHQASARGQLAAELVELSQGAPELIAFGEEAAALKRVKDADGRLVAMARRNALATGLGDALNLVLTGLTVTAVLALAIEATAAGRLDKVLIGALALLALASFEAVTPLAATAREISATLAAGQRVLELVDKRPAVQDRADATELPAWPFAISFERVTARYPGQPDPVLEDLSLRLEPGERVVLTGLSGTGKTTVVNLLLRFLDPEEGAVTLGSRDLRELRQDDVRRSIAVAGQDSHLFSTSIRENVGLARPDAGDALIEQALRRACVWDWVSSLPAGLDTRVGEQGKELSGGQRQRIVLARALLSEAPVLVLDEPTAHLDTDTATELMRDMMSAAAKRTVLLITHREEGVELADRVLSL